MLNHEELCPFGRVVHLSGHGFAAIWTLARLASAALFWRRLAFRTLRFSSLEAENLSPQLFEQHAWLSGSLA